MPSLRPVESLMLEVHTGGRRQLTHHGVEVVNDPEERLLLDGSHAGIINVLLHAPATFADIPIHCVVGGLHLVGSAPSPKPWRRCVRLHRNRS